MSLPYSVRLVCLCLEVLFLLNLAASLLVVGGSGTAQWLATRMKPRPAARLFLLLRMLPFGLSVLVVVTVCIPSYLRYEQNPGSETMGVFCVACAMMGAGLLLSSAVRGIGALAQVRRLGRLTHRLGCSDRDLCITPASSGVALMALVGVLRPRVLVSRRLVETLTGPQLEAAVRHERGHRVAQDNLKRLVLAMLPGIVPGTGRAQGGLGVLEAQWERFSELAADDYAAGGLADRSLALAETLVQVARLGNDAPLLSLASSLSAADEQLAQRVERLMAVPCPPRARTAGQRLSGYLFLLSSVAALGVLLPKLMGALYPVLESLLH